MQNVCVSCESKQAKRQQFIVFHRMLDAMMNGVRNLRVVYDVFFFSSRRRHTRLQGDWSSDVCSSDLSGAGKKPGRCVGAADQDREGGAGHSAWHRHAAAVVRSRMGGIPRGAAQGRSWYRRWCWFWRKRFRWRQRSEEHTSELQSPCNLVCPLLL